MDGNQNYYNLGGSSSDSNTSHNIPLKALHMVVRIVDGFFARTGSIRSWVARHRRLAQTIRRLILLSVFVIAKSRALWSANDAVAGKMVVVCRSVIASTALMHLQRGTWSQSVMDWLGVLGCICGMSKIRTILLCLCRRTSDVQRTKLVRWEQVEYSRSWFPDTYL